MKKRPSSTQVPESAAPRGEECCLEMRGAEGAGPVSPPLLLGLLFLSESAFHFVIYSLDQHMAAIPALHSACHSALTLIGRMC